MTSPEQAGVIVVGAEEGGTRMRNIDGDGGDARYFLLTTTQATLDLLKKHGFAPVYKETAGGHTWINWRDYLTEFAPQLFQ